MTQRGQVVLASGNRGKLKEFERLLDPLGLDVRPQSDWEAPEAEETGVTFLENALLKARSASAHCGLPAIADDSGLVVPALDGAPGIRSARFSESGRDADNNAKLLAAMGKLEEAQRKAHFYCAIVYLQAPQDPSPLVATAAWHGRILKAPRGEGGFGYDPLFFVAGENRSSAELPAEIKNRLSHRGQAVAALMRRLDQRRAHGR